MVKGERNEVKGDIIPKPEMNYPILVCYHSFANIHDLNSTMAVPVKSHRAKGGSNDVSLDICPMMRKKVISLPLCLWLQKCSPLCSQSCYTPLPAWLPLLQVSYINKLFVCYFTYCWILSVLRQKDRSFSMSWYQLSGFNLKTLCASPLLSQGLWVQVPAHRFEFQSEFWMGLSPTQEGVWFQNHQPPQLLKSEVVQGIQFKTPQLSTTRSKTRDFPGGPVVKTPCSQCRGWRFDSWSEN